jgi:hypothetical protein
MRISHRAPLLKSQLIDNGSFHSFIEKHHGPDMHNFVKYLVGSADINLADHIYQKAMRQLRQKKDLLKISVVLEPWLAVYFHNFCRIEMEQVHKSVCCMLTPGDSLVEASLTWAN